MRFNKQELLTLATQPSQKFEKEGILYVRERQEGFFRRTESEFSECFANAVNTFSNYSNWTYLGEWTDAWSIPRFQVAWNDKLDAIWCKNSSFGVEP